MRVDVVFPNGASHQTVLRDGEVTEVRAGDKLLLRVRRESRGHVTCQLWPEDPPPEKPKLEIARGTVDA